MGSPLVHVALLTALEPQRAGRDVFHGVPLGIRDAVERIPTRFMGSGLARRESGLGSASLAIYCRGVIGILRFIGTLNAAIWLGGSVFFTFVLGRVPFSDAMHTLLQDNYPYFSGAIAQLFVAKYFTLHVVCGAIALAHLGAEWLYLGRPARRSTLILLVLLFIFGVAGRYWLHPTMKDLHRFMHAPNVTQEVRDEKTRAFKIWHAGSQVLNLFALGGLVIYLWRANNPPDPTRFVSAMQFRG